MQLIPDTIDLAEYTKPSPFVAKVRKASDFTREVAAELLPRQDRERSPSLLSRKARGLLEFRPGEITCWAGYNGHRKSMFTSQVALDLCVQRQKVLIVSLEMTPARTMARMVRQATAQASPPINQIEDFHTWTDERLWLFDHVGRLDVPTMQGLCRYFAQEVGGQHLFIDSMMMVVGSEESMDEQKQFVTDLCRIAQETGLHLHVVAHCRKPQTGDESRAPSKFDIKGTGAISDQAHNVVMVWLNKSKKTKIEANPLDLTVRDEPDAVVSCEKQRNGSWEGRLQFWFDDASLRFCDDRTSRVEPYDLAPAQA